MATEWGVDGAPGGWVAVTRDGARGFATLRELARVLPRDAIAMVDVPIGLGEGDRACDKEARAALRPYGARVFPPPSRAQLALRHAPFRAGLGLSAQTYHILGKIAEADRLRRDARLREAHPELAFLLATGRVLPPKRTRAGRDARRRALRKLGLLVTERGLGVRAKEDDVNDAAILCWLAEEARAGRVAYYGAPPSVIWGRAVLPHAEARSREGFEAP